MTVYITVDDVLSFHDEVRKIFPKQVTAGHINRQAVDGIIRAAFFTVHGQPVHDTVFKQAAALMEGIIRLHPFPDGNKRTALLTTYLFLLENRCHMVVPPNTIRFMAGVAQNLSQTQPENAALANRVAKWLEDRTARTSDEYERLLTKHIVRPIRTLRLIAYTGVGILYVYYKLRLWLAADTHPEYLKNIWQTIGFLRALTSVSGKQFEGVEAGR